MPLNKAEQARVVAVVDALPGLFARRYRGPRAAGMPLSWAAWGRAIRLELEASAPDVAAILAADRQLAWHAAKFVDDAMMRLEMEPR